MKYINQSGEAYNGRDIIINNLRIINPSVHQLKEAGYFPKEEPEVTDDVTTDPLTLLALDDYKIIKCMEAYLCNEELPYDILELHMQRNALREQVNTY